MLKSLLTPLQPTGNSAIVLLDTTIQTGDVLAAFLSIRHMLDVPAFFFGLSQNVQHSEWIVE